MECAVECPCSYVDPTVGVGTFGLEVSSLPPPILSEKQVPQGLREGVFAAFCGDVLCRVIRVTRRNVGRAPLRSINTIWKVVFFPGSYCMLGFEALAR